MQIDSDDRNGMLWGDSGMLYVWIRRDDLRTRRFDRALGVPAKPVIAMRRPEAGARPT